MSAADDVVRAKAELEQANEWADHAHEMMLAAQRIYARAADRAMIAHNSYTLACARYTADKRNRK